MMLRHERCQLFDDAREDGVAFVDMRALASRLIVCQLRVYGDARVYAVDSMPPARAVTLRVRVMRARVDDSDMAARQLITQRCARWH